MYAKDFNQMHDSGPGGTTKQQNATSENQGVAFFIPLFFNQMGNRCATFFIFGMFNEYFE